MENIIEPLWNNTATRLAGEGLRELVAATGATTHQSSDEVIWFRPAEIQVFEFVFMNLLGFFVLRRWATKYWPRVDPPVPKKMEPSTFEAMCGLLLLFCALCQVVFKAVRPQPLIQLVWLVMPCHLHTYAWIYVLLSTTSVSSFLRRRLIVSVLLACHWGPASGIFPDFSDQRLAIEPIVFIIQHALLIGLPYYWAVRRGLLPLSFHLICFAWWIAFLQHFLAFPLLSWTTGLNMNYWYRGPPHCLHMWPFTTIYFRFKTTLVLAILTFVFYVPARLLQRIFLKR